MQPPPTVCSPAASAAQVGAHSFSAWRSVAAAEPVGGAAAGSAVARVAPARRRRAHAGLGALLRRQGWTGAGGLCPALTPCCCAVCIVLCLLRAAYLNMARPAVAIWRASGVRRGTRKMLEASSIGSEPATTVDHLDEQAVPGGEPVCHDGQQLCPPAPALHVNRACAC